MYDIMTRTMNDSIIYKFSIDDQSILIAKHHDKQYQRQLQEAKRLQETTKLLETKRQEMKRIP